MGSYVSIENGKGVIYGSNQDDYTFGPGDIKNSTFAGPGNDIPLGNIKSPSARFIIVFNDERKAQMDIILEKVDSFKVLFGLK